MRVHPTILAPKSAKWHFPAAFALLFFLLILNLMRGPREEVVAEKPEEKLIEVVVAQQSIETGQPLETATLVLERRPVNTLPSDAITSFEQIKDKVAAGPIPAGYPLAIALLGDPVPVMPIAAASSDVVEPATDPTEALLREIEKDTVAMPLSFNADAPQRGTRIAITLMRPKGEPIVVIEDAWVSKASNRDVVVRLSASQALVLQSAKNQGTFNFIELPIEGPSPYAGKGMTSEAQLKAELEGKIKSTVSSIVSKVNTPERKRYRNYAWVSGEGARYGIAEDGSIHPVDSQGYALDQ